MTPLDPALAWLADRLDTLDEAGEFGECCVDADCRACNILVRIHALVEEYEE